MKMVREKEVTIFSATQKPAFVRLQLPAGEAVSVPPLSSTLGQVQINSSDFCKAFNNASVAVYEPGVLLNVDLYRNSDNTYYFYIKSISTSYIFFQSSALGKFIPIEKLHDSFLIKLFSINKSITFNAAKNLFGSMRGIRFKIIL